MKKIITSAVAVAALTSGAFAAGTVGYAPKTFNTKYLEAVGDVNITSAQTTHGISYSSSAAINADSSVTFTLSNGAKFIGPASSWKLVNGGDINATGLALQDDDTKLVLQVGEGGMAANADFNLTTNTAAAEEYNLTMATDAASDIKVSVEASTVAGGNTLPIDGAKVADHTMFTSKTTEYKAKLVCKKIDINSDDKTSFVSNTTAPANTASTATCDFDMASPTAQNIDFDYGDLNITLELTGGNFTEGNLTAETTTGSDKETLNATATGYAYAYSTSELSTTALNSTITYTLNPGEVDLASVSFGHTATIKFLGANDNNATFDLADSTSTDMSWELGIYTAKVLNMRSAPANNKETYLMAYNHSSLEGAVKVKATNADGSSVDLDFGTLGAGKSVIITATEIMAKDISIENGFQVDLSLDGVPAKQGDLVAFQNSNVGQVALRVDDNNGKEKGQ